MLRKLATASLFLCGLFLATPAGAVCSTTSVAGFQDAAILSALNEICSYLSGGIAVTSTPATTGNGTAAAAQRVTIASDSTGAIGLNPGSAIVGKVGIDQTTPGTTNAVVPVGLAAGGAAASGNTVPMGAEYNSTLPTYANGNRANLQTGTRGSVNVQIMSTDGLNGALVLSGVTDGVSNSTNTLRVESRIWNFNGSTWDRQTVCTSQASATVTAAATTQLVALSGSTNIRVCFYQVGIATTGTFKFVSGTGSNCGTGTADITPATDITKGNVVIGGTGTGAVFSAGASNALCLAAVTGNVEVFIRYAQY